MFKVTIRDFERFDAAWRPVSDDSVVVYDRHYATTRIAFAKSPKRAFEKLTRCNGEHIVYGGHPLGYGGTPITRMIRIEKNGKKLSEVWS
jgi:hypothetical protein